MRMSLPKVLTNSWYQQIPGSWLLDLERSQMGNILAKTHGDHLMQIGGTNDLRHSADSPIYHRFQLVTEPSTLCDYPQIHASFHNLPILPDSLNVVLLIHVLEFTNHPVQLLEEVYQCLAPGGQLIILGFNPWSCWGLHKLFSGEKECPWIGKFWSRAQIKQWLRGYDYSIGMNKTLCFRSPRGKSRSRQFTLFTEVLGQLCFPTLGGVYLITARKKVYDRLKQRQFWWKKRLAVRRVIGLTTHV